MLIIEVKEGENIERVLKRYKRKFRRTKVLDELKSRQQFDKPSKQKRQMQKKAEYKQQYENQLEE